MEDKLLKKCNVCNLEKPLTEFYKNSIRKDGLEAMCKNCKKEYNKTHYKKNKNYFVDYYNKVKNIESKKLIRQEYRKKLVSQGYFKKYYRDHKNEKLKNN